VRCLWAFGLPTYMCFPDWTAFSETEARRRSMSRLCTRRPMAWGWKLVPAQSEHCVFFGDHETELSWLEWPIIWCPDANFHEQDNIRRAQGRPPGGN
jgi:hypothetical protein